MAALARRLSGLVLILLYIFYLAPENQAVRLRQARPSRSPRSRSRSHPRRPSPCRRLRRSQGLRLEMNFIEETWIHVYADGQSVWDGIKYKGESTRDPGRAGGPVEPRQRRRPGPDHQRPEGQALRTQRVGPQDILITPENYPEIAGDRTDETEQDRTMETPKRKGPRFIAAFVILLVVLFFAIEYFIRTSQEFSPTSVTNVLLSMMQVIVLILFLVLFFVLGRNLVKLYVERKRNIVGSHFKTKLVLFFIALSIIPTFLLFFFASDLISRNIELWFKTPFDKVIEDTKSVADGVYANAEETAYHYAVVLSREIQGRRLVQLENTAGPPGFHPPEAQRVQAR